ncbi:MAG: SRPBCC family protein [Caulobacteraceae bacterium]|nr:SRPBCC family protein [Caulobacter sp.]
MAENRMNSDQSVPDSARRRRGDRKVADLAAANQAVTIGKPREEVYARFRRFSELPSFMRNVERVDEKEQGRTHWVVKAPLGQQVEWDAVITADEAGRLIAWESAPGADIENKGRVEFRDAPGDRGTEVHARIHYRAPGGKLGKLVAELFGKEPGQQAHADLRQLKMLMETGEVATSQAPDAAPRYDKSEASPEAKAAETR